MRGRVRNAVFWMPLAILGVLAVALAYPTWFLLRDGNVVLPGGAIEVRKTSTLSSSFYIPPTCAITDCNCSDFKTQAEAQRFFEWAKTQPKPNPGSSRGRPGDWHDLDADQDARACETLP